MISISRDETGGLSLVCSKDATHRVESFTFRKSPGGDAVIELVGCRDCLLDYLIMNTVVTTQAGEYLELAPLTTRRVP